MQDYKSPCAMVMICATLVNIQTHTHKQHFDQLIRIAQVAELRKTRYSENLHSSSMLMYAMHALIVW